jgi:hypothetical protein
MREFSMIHTHAMRFAPSKQCEIKASLFIKKQKKHTPIDSNQSPYFSLFKTILLSPFLKMVFS